MKISLETNLDKKDLESQITTAITTLDTIIARTTMTTPQLTAAVKDMARYERAIIKRLIQF